MKLFFKSVPLATLAAVVYLYISFYYFGWYAWCLKEFKNEQEVSWTMVENAPNGGLYIMPYPFAKGAASEDFKSEAFVFAALWPFSKLKEFGFEIIYVFIKQIILASLLLWLLALFQLEQYWNRVLLVVVAGVIACVMVRIHQAIWYGFSASFTLVNSVDMLINFLINGLILARFARLETFQGEDLFRD